MPWEVYHLQEGVWGGRGVVLDLGLGLNDGRAARDAELK